MRTSILAALAAVAAIAASTVIATGSGGPPPQPGEPPEVRTVVGHGAMSVRVRKPARRTNRLIDRAVQRAHAAAFPGAVQDARVDAARLARAAGISLGREIGLTRDVGPPGWWDPEQGRFGVGRWCGIVGSPGNRRRECYPPSEQTVRVTLTLATG